MGTDDSLDFRRAFNQVERYVEDGWGIPVVLTEVADPNTGDFDGVTISVDWELEPLPIPPFQPSRWVSRFSF